MSSKENKFETQFYLIISSTDQSRVATCATYKLKRKSNELKKQSKACEINMSAYIGGCSSIKTA